MSENSLKKYLNFTSSDLEANRAGYMTEKQRRSIRNLFLIRLFLRIVFLGLIPLWLLLDLYKFGLYRVSTSHITIQYAYAGLLIFCYAWLIKSLIRQARNDYQKTLTSYVVECLHGRLHREMKSSGSGKGTFRHNYYIFIDETKFLVDQHVFQAFADNAVYTLYFSARTLLSVERHSNLE